MSEVLKISKSVQEIETGERCEILKIQKYHHVTDFDDIEEEEEKDQR